MKVDKNSPLGEMLLKMAADRDPKLRRAIRNDEVGELNIIALGAPDDEPKDLLESLFKGEDGCKKCECRDDRKDVKMATLSDEDAKDSADYVDDNADEENGIIEEIRSIADDPDTPESLAAPARVVLVAAELMDILNPIPRMVTPKRMTPYTARRAVMVADLYEAICHAQTIILDTMHNYPEFAEIIDKYLVGDGEEDTNE